jgi:hypothetical protein
MWIAVLLLLLLPLSAEDLGELSANPFNLESTRHRCAAAV